MDFRNWFVQDERGMIINLTSLNNWMFILVEALLLVLMKPSSTSLLGWEIKRQNDGCK